MRKQIAARILRVVPTDFLSELVWRGLVSDRTEGLPARLAAGPITGYCGFDPTADSLHLGHLLPIMGLVHLQRAGHRPIAVVGGGTGLIGDPSGKVNERPLADGDTIAENARRIHEQIARFADMPLVNNAEWLGGLDLVGFLRDVGKHFTVNYMLQKDSVRSRMDAGISFTEFAYMLLQSYDFLELHRRYGVSLQIGGSDQWGNITAGIELIRRTTAAEAHALTLPLVTTASGTKFGKTESGAVWLDAKKTSPYQFYQFWINVDDRDVGRYLRFFTLLSREDIEALEANLAAHPERREAQRALARDVTTRVHGDAAAQSAARVSAVLFGGSPNALTLDDLLSLSREIPFVSVKREEYLVRIAAGVVPGAPSLNVDVIDVATRQEIVASRSEARRLIQQGGLYVNDRRISADATAITDADLLYERYVILRKGARSRTLIAFV